MKKLWLAFGLWALASQASAQVFNPQIDASQLSTGTLPSGRLTGSYTGITGIAALTGDVTTLAGSLATAIGSTKVTSAMLNADVFSTAHSWGGQQTFTAPILGTPASGVGTNLTGTAAGLTAGNVTTNANLTGVITSVGNATSIASQTGTGTKFVVDTNPVLIGPTLGAATATSINGLTITSSTGTLTITNGKTLSVSNSMTLTATDGSTLAIGTGGTLASAAYRATGTSGTTVPLLDGANTWSTTQAISGSTDGSLGWNVTNSSAGNSAVARAVLIADAGNAVIAATSSTYNGVTGAADSLLINANSLSGGIQFSIDGVTKAILTGTAFTLGVAKSTSEAIGGCTIGSDALCVTGNSALPSISGAALLTMTAANQGAASGPEIIMNSTNANAGARNWAQVTNYDNFGDAIFRQSKAQGGDPQSASNGVSILAMSASGILIPTTTNAATTSALCFNTGTGLVTYNSTIGTCTVSSKRYKTELTFGSPKTVTDLIPRRFFYKDGSNGWGERLGLFAEDVCALDRALCHRNAAGEIENFDDRGVIALVVKALRDQQTQINGLVKATPVRR